MEGRRCVAGIDLGGTKVRIALVTREGEIVDADTWPTLADHGPDAVVAQIAHALQQLRERVGLPRRLLAGVGIGVPGPLNVATGVASTLPNLPGWEDYPVRERLQAALGAPVALGNDANVAALGEYRFGAGRGVQHMVMMTLGTGVGGGVIVNGRVLHGAVGAAGEIGHMVVAVGGALCGCGRRGCLEAYAGGASMERAAAAALAAPEAAGSKLAALAQAEGAADTRVLGMAAQAGDPIALGIFRQATVHLAAGIVSVVHLFNPELVLFGGGLVALRELFIDPAAEQARAALFPLHAQGLRFGYAALGDDMGSLGAAALALDEL